MIEPTANSLGKLVGKGGPLIWAWLNAFSPWMSSSLHDATRRTVRRTSLPTLSTPPIPSAPPILRDLPLVWTLCLKPRTRACLVSGCALATMRITIYPTAHNRYSQNGTVPTTKNIITFHRVCCSCMQQKSPCGRAGLDPSFYT